MTKKAILCSLLFLPLLSCDEGIRARVFHHYALIEGSWALEKMEYFEDHDLKKTIDSSNTTLSFLGNLNKNTNGKMKTSVGEFDFTYNVALENLTIDVPLANDVLPLDSPGRHSVFTIRFMAGNTFEILAPIEYYKPDDKLIYEVVYRFRRL